MQKFKTTTRGIVSILKASSDIRMHLGLSRVPVHTTIVRFVNKIRKQINKLLDIRQADCVAVDATGFELESKSYYYRKINKELFPNFIRKTKRFMKLSIAADVDKKLILTHKIRKSVTHDSRDFKFLVKDLECKNVIADKGYDSKELRKFVLFNLNARPHIPYRKMSSRARRGKLIIPLPDKKIYRKRPLVENIFFCIKQKYGSVLRNRSYSTQKVELISKLIAYNVDRMQHLCLLILRGLHHRLIQLILYKIGYISVR